MDSHNAKVKDKHKSKKRERHGDTDDMKKHKKRKEKEAVVRVVDDDLDGEDMWVEKNIDMDSEKPIATDIPTAESLKLVSRAQSHPDDPSLPKPVVAESSLKRDDWMLGPSTSAVESHAVSRPQVENADESLTDGYGEPSTSSRTLGGGIDFFSSLGKEKVRKPKPDLPDPDKPHISSRELNTQLKEGKSPREHSDVQAPKSVAPGGPGSQWRMMRLRRVYETAQDENRPVEEVAVERFGSLEAFEQSKEERRILDEREGKRVGRGRDAVKGKRRAEPDYPKVGEKGFMFHDLGGSGTSSRSSSFRRPGGPGESVASTPSPQTGGPSAARPRFDSLRLSSQTGTPGQQVRTPIPSVMTPQLEGKRALSPSSLNRLQAKVLRAKLAGGVDADKLEKEYDEEMRRANGISTDEGGVQTRTRVEVLPTLDGRGRLYDVGQGKDGGKVLPGNRKKKEKVETRDPKTGEIIRYNADDDTTTLGELLRQEKFGAGMADQKNLDMQFAQSIMTDGGFVNDLDYMDDNAERLGRQKMRSDAMKRQFAIQDYKRTQKALASCPYCYGEDDSLPKAPMIALGTRVYLSCTLHEELVPGHCLIVPIQHHLTILEGDDDVWDEIRNFMKSLMRMYSEDDKGVVFYETVISLKWQKHSVIECVPVPWEQFDVLPGYFKESIVMSEAEWSQHKKLIDFSTRPGGFRRMMVPNLPYFMVQFDHKGEKGYGHVIEGSGDYAGDEEGLDEGEKGGGDFPRYFAGEIIGNLLELEPRRWRRPRRLDFGQNKERAANFRKRYDLFDWTGLIDRSGR
ncbi:CwfJ C-terminus 1-domain-containing protein-like protein [Russula earlei]|uniref:CwfJ C-terminus 1-domain-containing protein-like protein n=1 Tax=Russula earlei TaxID=71964 RepID=A0ACC0UC59_9AGAM|nr:CwfJ C-terminus 1-domain-containing protein-like protein [Russula earlei]